ncbi:MAG: hydantoinase/oxoprolinase family protein [Bacillota bacterium]
MSHYRVGIDIGGTFTDAVVIDDAGRIRIFKDLSTPADPSLGLLNCLRKAAAAHGLEFEDFLRAVELLVHGTTVATNTMIQYKGAKTALITTRGFRDSLEMFRAHKHNLWDLSEQRPPMIVPRYLRYGVTERIDATGTVVTPLDAGEVREAVADMRGHGVESVAVCTLFSYLNDVHELEIKKIINEEWPGVHVSISSEILRQIREFERTSTTVVNAYVSPRLSTYLRNLQKALKERGLRRDFLVTQSNGGVMSAEFAAEHGVTTLLSGPSAGAVGGMFFSEILGEPNLIITDMGGTSFDVTLIKDGQYTLTTDGWVSGYRVAVPSIDIHTVGAGGGSIAYIDEGGMLKVGPLSAGADPGPASYGRGGKEPTVTDANVALGYLNPGYFLGGEMSLDAQAATRVIQEKVAAPLGLSVTEAAYGIFKLVNANMADAIRVVSIERGHDPRECALIAAGGAGPIHAVKLAEDVGVPLVIVPGAASVFCALGMLESDLKHDYVRTFYSSLGALDFDAINGVFSTMEEEGRRTLAAEGTLAENMIVTRSLDMRYVGQHHEVHVDIGDTEVSPVTLPELAEAFHAAHERLYTYSEPESDIEIINIRVTAVGKVAKTPLSQAEEVGPDSSGAKKGQRTVYFEELGGMAPVDTYDGHRLLAGNVVEGPAVIELVTTSVVLFPGNRAKVDTLGNLLVEVKSGVR